MFVRRLPRGAAVVAGVLVASLGMQGCGKSTSADPGGQAPNIPTPLATSVDTGQGTWVTVPMGRLDDPQNTFWQLFYRPAGGTTWSNQVETTATATNSGLVLTPVNPDSLAVGIRLPPNLYNYAPLIVTANGGRSWSNGLLTEGLADRPDALATGPDGRGLAIGSTPGHDTEVLGSAGGYSSWQELTSLKQLATSVPGRSCHLVSLTAVGFLANTPLVGGSCALPGVVGLFSQADGGWQLAGRSTTPPSWGHAPIEVLGVHQTGSGVTALLGVTGPAGTDVAAAWSVDGGHSWATSSELPLNDGQLTSFGPAGGDGLFVLSSTPSGSAMLNVIAGPGATWRQLGTPPPSTATVAFGSQTTVDAFAVDQSTLTVWSLVGDGWVKSQVIHVSIQYGSSQ